jgi:hypothetical protein
MSWWLEKIFPAFVTKSKSAGSSGAPLIDSSSELWSSTAKHTFLSEDVPVPHASFISDLAANKGAGKRIDEYVSHHVGHSALSKMGGSATQMARRLVSAAQITLSLPLILAHERLSPKLFFV